VRDLTGHYPGTIEEFLHDSRHAFADPGALLLGWMREPHPPRQLFDATLELLRNAQPRSPTLW
jgi:hypothetical protein